MGVKNRSLSSVLVIDDSLNTRRLIRDILERDGYTIWEAENGLAGLHMATTKTPDCILLDLIMPDIDGLRILRALHEQRSEIPVIVLTAHMQDAVRGQCLELGAAAFIPKPPNADELRHTVKKVLGPNEKPTLAK